MELAVAEHQQLRRRLGRGRRRSGPFRQQRDLRDSQNAELRTLLDYRRAQVDFERVQEIPAAGGAGVTPISAGGGNASRATAGGFGGFGN